MQKTILTFIGLMLLAFSELSQARDQQDTLDQQPPMPKATPYTVECLILDQWYISEERYILNSPGQKILKPTAIEDLIGPECLPTVKKLNFCNYLLENLSQLKAIISDMDSLEEICIKANTLTPPHQQISLAALQSKQFSEPFAALFQQHESLKTIGCFSIPESKDRTPSCEDAEVAFYERKDNTLYLKVRKKAQVQAINLGAI